MPHTAARAYEQRDSVQRRSHRPRHPPSHNRTLVSYSEAASGLHTSYQGPDALANLPGSRNITTHATDPHPRGWVLRAGAPALRPPRTDAPHRSLHLQTGKSHKNKTPLGPALHAPANPVPLRGFFVDFFRDFAIIM